MSGNGETEGQVGGVADADAHRDEGFRNRKSIVADLQQRIAPSEIEAIVERPSKAERLAKPAGTGGELACCVGCRNINVREATVRCHPFQPGNRLKSAQQNAAGKPVGFASDVHTEVKAVNAVNISMPGGTEEDRVARRGSAMGVSRGIRSCVMGTEVGFSFHDAACDDTAWCLVDEKLAEEARGDEVRRGLKEATGKKAAKGPVRHGSPLPPFSPETRGTRIRFALHLCVLFHSFSRESTSSAWPSGVTLGKMWMSVRSGPMRNVVRSMPHTFLPYMFFSFITPN